MKDLAQMMVERAILSHRLAGLLEYRGTLTDRIFECQQEENDCKVNRSKLDIEIEKHSTALSDNIHECAAMEAENAKTL